MARAPQSRHCWSPTHLFTPAKLTSPEMAGHPLEIIALLTSQDNGHQAMNDEPLSELVLPVALAMFFVLERLTQHAFGV